VTWRQHIEDPLLAFSDAAVQVAAIQVCQVQGAAAADVDQPVYLRGGVKADEVHEGRQSDSAVLQQTTQQRAAQTDAWRGWRAWHLSDL
jgi:hypothetical protein